MIDHASIGVRDLAAAAAFYETVLATIGLAKLVVREATVGFGKSYPELWLNARPGMTPLADDSGSHLCLRARSREQVDAFHRAALAAGATDEGAPGLRPEYSDAYYANVTQQLLAYALNRKGRAGRLYDYEMPSVRAIVRSAAAKDYRWSSIISGVITSAPFRMKNIVP